MDKQRELTMALAAMIDIVRKCMPELNSEEIRALMNASELLAEAQGKCDDCVDY
jgi:hypothetical protein